MAVVHLRSGVRENADELNIWYPSSAGTVTRAGEIAYLGGHCTFVRVALASLPTAASGDEQIVGGTTTIPNGAFIEKVSVLVLKEPTDASGTANLDFGLVDQDGSTEIDFNGFLAAADAWNAGTDLGKLTDYVVGTTEAGALIGTKITNTGYLTCSADTADFTGGVVELRVYWTVPLTADL